MTTMATSPEETGGKKRETVRRLIVTLKDKGGTGASFILRRLCELHRLRSSSALLVDGDGTVGSLYQYLAAVDGEGKLASDQENGVRTFALHGEETDRDEIATILDSQRETIIMDLPATALTMLKKIDKDIGWLGMVRDRGYRMTVITAITPYKSSMYDLQDAIELLSEQKVLADYLAVLNIGQAEDLSDFEEWNESEALRMLESVRGRAITFPRLKPRIAAKLDKYNMLFEPGLTSEHISIADKARLQKWLSETRDAFASVGALVGLK
jgi:hypothetical protein